MITHPLRQGFIEKPVFADQVKQLSFPLNPGLFSLGGLLSLPLFKRKLSRGRALDVIGLETVRDLAPKSAGFEPALFGYFFAQFVVDGDVSNVAEHLGPPRVQPLGHHLAIPLPLHLEEWFLLLWTANLSRHLKLKLEPEMISAHLNDLLQCWRGLNFLFEIGLSIIKLPFILNLLVKCINDEMKFICRK